MSDELTLNLATSNPVPEPRKRRPPSSDDDEPENPNVKKKQKTSYHKPEDEGPFISSLFNHNPEVPQLNLGDVDQHKEDVFSEKKFTSFGIHPYLAKNLNDAGMTTLTLVQSKAIPVLLAGKDALVKSQTGSGKTLAYAIPVLQKLQELRPKISRADGVRALVIVPTRELALQSLEWFQKLCRTFAWIVPGALLGGEKKKSEKARLRKGINILISTPGRLIDHIEHTECLKFENLSWLILDEADRMLELGYERDVQKVITALNEQLTEGKSRQTVLLSATLTTGIQQLSEVSMKHPMFVDAAVSEAEQTEDSLKNLVTPENLKQTFLIAPAKLRLVTLGTFLLWKCRFTRAKKILVFMATQDMVDYHLEIFGRCLNHEGGKKKKKPLQNMTEDAKQVLKENEESGIDEDIEDDDDSIAFLKLHGSMNQKDRVDVFNQFRRSTSGVLFCTDVAARGLDLPQVDWIVQYTAPTTQADYIHRVGRTARIGAKGSSVMFLLPSEANFIRDLEAQRIPLVEMTVEKVLSKLFQNPVASQKTGKMPHTVEEAATNLQMAFENAVEADQGLREKGCQAYVSFIRSYASYPREARETFCFKSLHLGHIAKSYALRDPPTKITGIGKGGHWAKNAERKKKDKSDERVLKAQRKRVDRKKMVMSEYASGFDGIQFDNKPKVKGLKKFKKKTKK